MKVHAVVSRAITDPLYALELSGKASEASRKYREKGVVERADWEGVLAEFAESPEELSRMFVKEKLGEDGTTWTITTTATVTTSSCTVTVTTVGTTIL
ncbi:MAG: hypothetical protein AB1440_16660 [Pseudomonadota bacterium]|jgi:hypothetical protein